MMSGQAGDAIHFVKHVQIMMPNTTIFLYDLGLSEHESQLVLPYCNSGMYYIFKTTYLPAYLILVLTIDNSTYYTRHYLGESVDCCFILFR